MKQKKSGSDVMVIMEDTVDDNIRFFENPAIIDVIAIMSSAMIINKKTEEKFGGKLFFCLLKTEFKTLAVEKYKGYLFSAECFKGDEKFAEMSFIVDGELKEGEMETLIEAAKEEAITGKMVMWQ